MHSVTAVGLDVVAALRMLLLPTNPLKDCRHFLGSNIGGCDVFFQQLITSKPSEDLFTDLCVFWFDPRAHVAYTAMPAPHTHRVLHIQTQEVNRSQELFRAAD